MHSLALVTYAAAPNLTDDDRLLHRALSARGVRAEPVRWDTDTDWARFDAVVVRSTWDYFVRMNEFTRWLDALEESRVEVWNPIRVIRWNADKRYLGEMQQAGISTIPTVHIGAGGAGPDAATLAKALEGNGWKDAVVKPAVSGGALDTWRTSAATADADEARFRDLCARAPGGVLVQPFMEEITRDGEWSLIFIDGTYSHAAIKRARAGDFRVQREHGGTYEAARPSAALIESASRALAAGAARAGVALGDLAYARVDGIVRVIDGTDHLFLMELELIEPNLFFLQHPEAADRMADALIERVSARGAASTAR